MSFSPPLFQSAVFTLVFAAAITVHAQSPITVTVDATKVLHTVPANFHGSNFVALWNDSADSPAAVNAYSQMGLKLLRFPGGVPAEYYDWEKPLESGLTEITPERAWKLASTSDAEMIFQTNAFNDREKKNKKTGQPYRFDNSARHAADWVASARQAGIQVAFWEIGNEPELDADEEMKKSPEATYKFYNAKFDEQARAIKAVDSKARIMGPASANTWFWWGQRNLEKFLKAHGNREGTGLVDAISLHWYPDGSKGSWDANRGLAQSWLKGMEYIEKTIRTYDSRELPIYLTEWNWGCGDKNDGAAEYANALGCADCIGMFLRTGVSGQTHFCLQHIKRGWGVLASKKDNKSEAEPSPTYFALLMAGRLGGSVLSTTTSADEANVLSAYATSQQAGRVEVMLINKTSSPQEVKISLTGTTPSNAIVTTLKPAEQKVTAHDVVFNGAAAPSPANGPLPSGKTVPSSDALNATLDPYELRLISFRP